MQKQKNITIWHKSVRKKIPPSLKRKNKKKNMLKRPYSIKIEDRASVYASNKCHVQNS